MFRDVLFYFGMVQNSLSLHRKYFFKGIDIFEAVTMYKCSHVLQVCNGFFYVYQKGT